MKKCDRCAICVNSKIMLSENGLKYQCTLYGKKGVECLTGIKDHFVEFKGEKGE